MSERERKPLPDQEPLFALGQVVSTRGALDAFEQAGQDPLDLLSRHVTGDWGELEDEDRATNNWSLKEGARLLSAYTLSSGVRIWNRLCGIGQGKGLVGDEQKRYP
jgi:hypothetical protein